MCMYIYIFSLHLLTSSAPVASGDRLVDHHVRLDQSPLPSVIKLPRPPPSPSSPLLVSSSCPQQQLPPSPQITVRATLPLQPTVCTCTVHTVCVCMRTRV